MQRFDGRINAAPVSKVRRVRCACACAFCVRLQPMLTRCRCSETRST
jgi:hypothetical protein